MIVFCAPPPSLVRACTHAAACYINQELEKRYYSSDAADAAKAAKAAMEDFNTLSAYFSQRGWASLSVGSSGSSDGRRLKQLTEADFRELDGQLDEVRWADLRLERVVMRRPSWTCSDPCGAGQPVGSRDTVWRANQACVQG